MANILFISYDGMTDALGQSQVIPYLLGLQKAGHQIHILSTEKIEIYLQKKEQIKRLLDSKIIWHHIKYTKKPPLISTLKDIASLWAKTKELHKLYHFDIIHCRSYISALIGLKMKQKYKTKFIFDMRGFWADERVDGKIWNLKNPIFSMVYRFFKQKEIEFLTHADRTISLTHNAKEKIKRFDALQNKTVAIDVIPCCVDLDRFNPKLIKVEEQKILRKQLEIVKGDFVISYLGSIGTWYMLDEMLDFFKILLSQKSNALFLFITQEKKEFILQKAKQRCIPIDRIKITNADYTEVSKYLSLSSFSIFFILPVFSKSASSPIKQGEIMSMGIPIICNSGVGDTDYVLQNYPCGVLVNEFNKENYLSAIKKIDQIEFDATKIRSAAGDFYALTNGIANYAACYQKALSK